MIKNCYDIWERKILFKIITVRWATLSLYEKSSRQGTLLGTVWSTSKQGAIRKVLGNASLS